MKLMLAAVGRAKNGPERALFEQYAGRLRLPLEVKEVEEKRPVSSSERMAREADLLLACVPAGAVVVALDERGRMHGSEAFAKVYGGWLERGAPCIAFLIGGADGHGEAVRARADALLSLSPMTWPHMLVRAMLAEQLFRAQSILEGHPYHRA